MSRRGQFIEAESRLRVLWGGQGVRGKEWLGEVEADKVSFGVDKKCSKISSKPFNPVNIVKTTELYSLNW